MRGFSRGEVILSNIATATAALKRFRRSGAVSSAVPPPERLLRDKGYVHVERSLSFVDLENEAGVVTPVAIRGSRIRVSVGPFEQMVSRQALDTNDPDRNRALAAAGRRYASIWRTAGLDPLKGQDPSKIRSTSAPEGLLVGPERMSNAWGEYRLASSALDRWERIAVDAIVLHDAPLGSVGRVISALKSDKQAQAVAGHELRAGLEKLAVHFGILTPSDDQSDSIIAGLVASAAS